MGRAIGLIPSRHHDFRSERRVARLVKVSGRRLHHQKQSFRGRMRFLSADGCATTSPSMGLPNAHRAFVEREKIVAYLLNATHPDNGGKAPFFRSLGFDANDWSRFAAALRRLALTGVVSRRLDSTHGTKYVIDGRLEGSGASAHLVRTVWIVEHGQDAARLVTAFPHGN
jgi:hypothetical protein